MAIDQMDVVSIGNLARGSCVERFDDELKMRAGKDGQEPTCALFESDGGKWRNDAIQNVKAYIKKELPKAIILA